MQFNYSSGVHRKSRAVARRRLAGDFQISFPRQQEETMKHTVHGGLHTFPRNQIHGAVHAQALCPYLVEVLAWPLFTSHGPLGCQAHDVVYLSGCGAPTVARPRSR